MFMRGTHPHKKFLTRVCHSAMSDTSFPYKPQSGAEIFNANSVRQVLNYFAKTKRCASRCWSGHGACVILGRLPKLHTRAETESFHPVRRDVGGVGRVYYYLPEALRGQESAERNAARTSSRAENRFVNSGVERARAEVNACSTALRVVRENERACQAALGRAERDLREVEEKERACRAALFRAERGLENALSAELGGHPRPQPQAQPQPRPQAQAHPQAQPRPQPRPQAQPQPQPQPQAQPQPRPQSQPQPPVQAPVQPQTQARQAAQLRELQAVQARAVMAQSRAARAHAARPQVREPLTAQKRTRPEDEAVSARQRLRVDAYREAVRAEQQQKASEAEAREEARNKLAKLTTDAPDLRTFFLRLGVPAELVGPQNTRQALKQARKVAMVRFHPDKAERRDKDETIHLRALATEVTMWLTRAWKALPE